jgi:hypothetical protein
MLFLRFGLPMLNTVENEDSAYTEPTSTVQSSLACLSGIPVTLNGGQ